MPNDEILQRALEDAAADSNGEIEFAVVAPRQLSEDLGIRLGRTSNPIYRFKVYEGGGVRFEAVAYTLILDGNGRAASRAEALAKAIVDGGDEFQSRNPFLLVYDYRGQRLLAVAAARLFGEFAERYLLDPTPAAESANFSLTPNFSGRRITMQAPVGAPEVIARSLNDEGMGAAFLRSLLDHVRNEAAYFDWGRIERAIRERLENNIQPGVAAAVVNLPAMQNEEHPERDDENVRVSPRTWRMIVTAIQSSPAVILVGPPGTGKTALLRRAIAELGTTEQFARGGGRMNEPLWATPDESWTARELVGGDTVVNGEIVFRPGWVLRSVAEDRWLVLDEANRGDMDRIFGGLLTWLAGGQVTVGTDRAEAGAKTVELAWKRGPSERSEDGQRIKFAAGDNWRIIGTYNALDAQRVFRFGAALGRRFARVPVPAAEPDVFAEILAGWSAVLPETIRRRLHALYKAHYESDSTRLGPALFQGLCRYLTSALAAAEELAGNDEMAEEDDLAGEAVAGAEEAANQEAQLDQRIDRIHFELLSEAYLAHVGTWLAHLEDEEAAALQERVIRSGALTEEDWSWINGMLPALA